MHSKIKGLGNQCIFYDHKLGVNAGSFSLFLFPLTPSSTIFSPIFSSDPSLLILAIAWFLSVRQGEKKVVSDSPGLLDFAIGLVNSVLNLPEGQVKFFWEI